MKISDIFISTIIVVLLLNVLFAFVTAGFWFHTEGIDLNDDSWFMNLIVGCLFIALLPKIIMYILKIKTDNSLLKVGIMCLIFFNMFPLLAMSIFKLGVGEILSSKTYLFELSVIDIILKSQIGWFKLLGIGMYFFGCLFFILSIVKDLADVIKIKLLNMEQNEI